MDEESSIVLCNDRIHIPLAGSVDHISKTELGAKLATRRFPWEAIFETNFMCAIHQLIELAQMTQETDVKNRMSWVLRFRCLHALLYSCFSVHSRHALEQIGIGHTIENFMQFLNGSLAFIYCRLLTTPFTGHDFKLYAVKRACPK